MAHLPQARASETVPGRAWLTNFAEVDRPTAALLIDGLRFANFGTLSFGLRDLLNRLIASGEIEGPALVVPERSFGDFEMRDGAREPFVAFDDFLPGGPLPVTPGSEGLVGRLLRDVVRESVGDDGRNWLKPGADLEDLRESRCKSIVIATDYIGSGNQIRALAQSLERQRTIRSWRSSRFLRIYAVAFAATPVAINRLRSKGGFDAVWSVEGAPSFSSVIGWTDELRARVRELCLQESRVKPALALGYGSTAGLYASEHGAPNNLPAVFWQSGSWRPLFPKRRIPTEVANAFGDLRPRPPLRELADHVGHLRIGRNERLDSMPPLSADLLRLLILDSRKPRSGALVAAQLGVDVAEIDALRDSLKTLGLIDLAGRATRFGRAEIAAQKRARRRTSSGIRGTTAMYFPEELRRGG